MAQYWVYLNNEVVGPYSVEQLIRLRGFSRQTQVQVDNGTGATAAWISPAEIPELAHIFKAVDDQMASTPTPAPRRPVPKPQMPKPMSKPIVTTAPAPHRQAASSKRMWLIALPLMLCIAAALAGYRYWHSRPDVEGQDTARALVLRHTLPATSLYRSLDHYVQEKSVQPRWEYEKLADGLYRVSVSWYAPEGSTVYAFETNPQAQTVRGLNSAAVRLLNEGFPPPPAKPKPAAKPVPSNLFPGAIKAWQEAVATSDFAAVWSMFSTRKRSEMRKGGMSQDGFIRLQTLTSKVDSGAKSTVLKTQAESDTQMLVLMKQTQTGRPDIFVKQFWTFENDEWKLDDEDKRAAPAAPAAEAKPLPASLPGMN